jgi:DHA1 family tetracycline resistance protein-like MFS transporter
MMANSAETKFSMLPLFLVVLLDMIGLGIIIPILAPVLLDTTTGFFSAATPFATKTIVLGLLLATYPLAQFFGAPILGTLSDKFGRKKLLILSLVGTFIGYIIMAIGMWQESLVLLFISRLIDGFTGGNISIAQSAIADKSEGQNKARRFGMIGLAFGLGMIIGPAIGGILADLPYSWSGHPTPFVFAAVLCLINIVLFIFLFKETLEHRREAPIHFFTGFKNFRKAFTLKHMKVLFLFVFLIALGFNFFTQFFQVFLVEKFAFTERNIGIFFAYLGLCIAIAQGFVVRPITKRFKPEQILPITVLGTSIGLALYLLPSHPSGLYWIVPLVALCNGLTFPNLVALVSDSADKQSQGEILGINQSVQSAGMVIPPLIAGVIAGLNYSLPVIIASALIFSAWIVFIFWVLPLRRKAHSA